MSTPLEFRNSLPDDLPALEVLYRDAFPEENLVPLVQELLLTGQNTISLVATLHSIPVGHVVFTESGVSGIHFAAALLGPLAVAPSEQRKGIGTSLVQEGFARLMDKGISWVFVLGDPKYYGRLGFLPESDVQPPYPLPEEWDGAWQSKSLSKTLKNPKGEILLPEVWLKRNLWEP